MKPSPQNSQLCGDDILPKFGESSNYVEPASQKAPWSTQLSDIDTENHLITGDILSKVRSLHLEAMGASNVKAIMDTMQILKDHHPHAHAEAIQHINRTHDFLFNSMQEKQITCR